jgi:hypothetical protein
MSVLGRGVGLVELLERARGRALARGAIFRYHFDPPHNFHEVDADASQAAATAVADEVCSLALGGQFLRACDVAYPYDLFVPMSMWEHLALLDECPAWVEFTRVVELAERTDSFLAALERDRRLAPLARDCRAELNLLGVLADLCEDVGLPRAADDARHLHGLACDAAS